MTTIATDAIVMVELHIEKAIKVAGGSYAGETIKNTDSGYAKNQIT